MARALAHVELVNNKQPIEGADRIELLTVLGWNVIQQKDTAQIGDKVVYIEIDSKVPETEPFEFLEKRGYKVKSMKMRGCISQGLVMTFDQLGLDASKYNVGDDLTDKLGIKKIETDEEKRLKSSESFDSAVMSMKARHKNFFSKPWVKKLMKYQWFKKVMFFLFGKKKDKPKSFPGFIHKTDEVRVENIPIVLGQKKHYIRTEKIDGCLDKSVSVMTDSGPVHISTIVNKHLPVKVLTYNEKLDRCEYREIEEYHKWERVSDMYDIVVVQRGVRCGGNRPKHIKCTSEHSFYVGDGKYKKAKELSVEDKIYHRLDKIDSLSKQILLGTLLGDGSISSKYGVINGGVDFSHSVKQIDYFNELCRLLGGLVTNTRTITSGYGSEMLSAHVQSTPEFKEFIISNCVRDGKKFVNVGWVKELTPLSLAIWYMDDGSIRNADDCSVRPTIHISTNNFTLEECCNLKTALLSKFGILAEIRNSESYKGNVLYLNTDNTEKFCQLIAPYVCESMKYKLPKNLRDYEYTLRNIESSSCGGITETQIVSINKIDDYKDKFVYDLTVGENHNYFANGILTHNTSSTYAIQKKGRKSEFIVCSRNVRQQDVDQKCYHDCGNVYWEMFYKYNIGDFLTAYQKETGAEIIILQGETYGDSLQGNPYKLDHREFRGFNLIKTDARNSVYNRIPSKVAEKICAKYGIMWVPILDEVYELPDNMKDMKETAEGNSVINPKVLREGIVYRCPEDDSSFKNVSNSYLLKHNG